jgi:hypothetical protein
MTPSLLCIHKHYSLLIENVLKLSTDSDTNLTVGMKLLEQIDEDERICSSDVYRQQSGWCRYLYSTLIHFLAFNLSRFSFYINISSD